MQIKIRVIQLKDNLIILILSIEKHLLIQKIKMKLQKD